MWLLINVTCKFWNRLLNHETSTSERQLFSVCALTGGLFFSVQFTYILNIFWCANIDCLDALDIGTLRYTVCTDHQIPNSNWCPSLKKIRIGSNRRRLRYMPRDIFCRPHAACISPVRWNWLQLKKKPEPWQWRYISSVAGVVWRRLKMSRDGISKRVNTNPNFGYHCICYTSDYRNKIEYIPSILEEVLFIME